jgi:hypothetical protein
MLEDLLFLLPPFIRTCNCGRSTEQEERRATYDIFDVFFVTAARTPPSPLSLAVPFFLPFFEGI